MLQRMYGIQLERWIYIAFDFFNYLNMACSEVDVLDTFNLDIDL